MIDFTVEDCYFIKCRVPAFTGVLNTPYNKTDLVSAVVKIKDNEYNLSQINYLQSLPKDDKFVRERINITLRKFV